MDCLWSGYSVWSSCSATCGLGERRRTRKVLQSALHGGAECAGSEEETEPCPLPACPAPSCPSSWGAWSDCTAPCGPGVRSRSKKVETANTSGTLDCTHEFEEEECQVKTCLGKIK